MRRRTFIARTATLLAVPNIVRAQGFKPTKRLAMVRDSGPVSSMTPNGSPRYKALFEELGSLGYIEGQSLIVFRASAEGHPDRYRAVLQQAIDASPDVIWCPGPVPAALKSTTTTIPIVVLTGDPVAWGFTTNLARPSGNITGVSIDGGQEIWGKRLSILKEAVVSLKKPSFLSTSISWEGIQGQGVRQAADELGLSLTQALLKADVSSDSYAPVFEETKASGADGLLVSDAGANMLHRRTITALAAQHRLPTVYPYREFVLDGGLLAYATDLNEVIRVAAGQIARLFAGAKPGDIPFVQPTKFQLIANVKAAQAIGLTLPQSLLLSADEVVE
jgi:putative tryptophan/tyrosine transport system substrate-binding protein